MKLFETKHGSHEAHGVDGAAENASAPATGGETKPSGKRRGRRWLIALAVVVLVVLAVVIGYSIWERPPEITPAPTKAPAQTVAPTAAPTKAPDSSGANGPGTEAPVESAELTPEPTPEVYSEPPVVDMTGDRKEGVYTFMIVGLDVANGLTDTIMIVSFDTKNHTMSLTNIPRDTIANIASTYAPKRINTVYPGAMSAGHDGAEALRTQMRNMLGFDVDCYCVVNIWGVARVVDAIGGLWYDVPRDYVYVDYVQDLYIDIKQGYQQLSGQQVVQLCRFRADYARGDIQRIDVQHDILKTLARQTLSLGNISNLPQLLQIFAEEVTTNMSTANVAWFVRQFMQCKAEDIVFQTMPLGGGGLVNGVSMVAVAPDAWLQMINDSINPYKEDVQLYNLSLLVAGESFAYSTNGVIAGGPDSFYCTLCSAAAGEAVAHYPGAHNSYECEQCSAFAGKTISHVPGDHLYDEEGKLLRPEETEDPNETDDPNETAEPTETPAPTEAPEPTQPVEGGEE